MWSSTFIDEFSYRKRHHYLTLVVDHDRQRVVWAGKGRSAQTLEAFFDRLGPAGCERLQLVTADLAASWQKALRARVPHARLVFDRFHVERLATEAVDEVRRAEQRGADAKTAKTLKGSRYCLLKHPKRLKPGPTVRGKRAPSAARALSHRPTDRPQPTHTSFRRTSILPTDSAEDPRLEQSTKGRLSPAQPRIGEHHRLGLAHRIGNQSLSVKTFHRVPVERLPRTRAHHGFTFEDAQIEERQHGFIDLVVDPFPTHREQGSPASSGASRGAESRPTLLRRDAPLSIAQPRAVGNLDDAWSQTGSTSVDLTGADTATRGFATR